MDYSNTIKYKQPTIIENEKSIDDTSLEKMIKQWKTFEPVTKLHLRHNLIRSSTSQFGCFRSLTHLDLFDNPIGNDGASDVVKLFEKLRLKSLDMSWTSLNDRGAVKFATMLETNNTLQILGLAGNNIGPEAIRILAKSLELNTTLVELNLEVNPIRDEGACHLIQLLKVNNTLQVIKLRENKISLDNTSMIALLLKRNRAKYLTPSNI